MGSKPRREMHAVSGSASARERDVNEMCVSPRPWRRIRMLVGRWPEGGGTVERVKEEGKSEAAGRRGIELIDVDTEKNM